MSGFAASDGSGGIGLSLRMLPVGASMRDADAGEKKNSRGAGCWAPVGLPARRFHPPRTAVRCAIESDTGMDPEDTRTWSMSIVCRFVPLAVVAVVRRILGGRRPDPRIIGVLLRCCRATLPLAAATSRVWTASRRCWFTSWGTAPAFSAMWYLSS